MLPQETPPLRQRRKEVDDIDILRDENMPGIYIVRKIPTEEEKSCPYDIYHACIYCGEMASNIQAHLLTHTTKPAILEILDLKKQLEPRTCTEENRKLLQNKIQSKQNNLRMEGDHFHNVAVMEKKKGELLVCRRPADMESFHSSTCGPCNKCHKWFLNRDTRDRHQKVCDI